MAPLDADPQTPAERARAMARSALHAAPAGAVPPPARPAPFRRVVWVATGLGAAALALAIWLATAGSVSPMAPGEAVRAEPPMTVPLADEAELLAAPADTLRAFRLRQAPQILVLLFPSLTAQGLALDRAGAFIEKAGVPHDHVLDDAGLARAIASSHDTLESYYYGHDYRAADLARFFAAANGDGVGLNPQEVAVRRLLARISPPLGAVITLPPLSDRQQIDRRARAVILRHEISHGVYFTDPAYAAYTRRFWEQDMAAGERERFRRFLGTQDYDTGNDDLMRNEMQAYLAHTPDEQFFGAAQVGMTKAAESALRRRFVDGMPPSWLKDMTEDTE